MGQRRVSVRDWGHGPLSHSGHRTQKAFSLCATGGEVKLVGSLEQKPSEGPTVQPVSVLQLANNCNDRERGDWKHSHQSHCCCFIYIDSPKYPFHCPPILFHFLFIFWFPWPQITFHHLLASPTLSLLPLPSHYPDEERLKRINSVSVIGPNKRPGFAAAH